LSYARDEHEKTWFSWIYQRRRGDKNLDAVIPLFARTWDDRDKSHGLYIGPFYLDWQDPANRTRYIFPAFLHDHQEGISDTWWALLVGRKQDYEHHENTWWFAPTFVYDKTDTSYRFSFHPLVYVQRAPKRNFEIAAPFWANVRDAKKQTKRVASFPFYWDFQDFKLQKRSRVVFPFYWAMKNPPKGRETRVGFPFYYDVNLVNRNAHYTVGFPVYGRSIVGDRTRHFSINTMYEKRTDSEHSWQFHFFPFFSRGGSTKSKWWNVFYGLAGYEQQGKFRRARVFWLPFRLRDAKGS